MQFAFSRKEGQNCSALCTAPKGPIARAVVALEGTARTPKAPADPGDTLVVVWPPAHTVPGPGDGGPRSPCNPWSFSGEGGRDAKVPPLEVALRNPSQGLRVTHMRLVGLDTTAPGAGEGHNGGTRAQAVLHCTFTGAVKGCPVWKWS